MSSKNLHMKLGLSAAIVVAIIPVVLFLIWFREPFGSAEIIQSRKPLSVAEARRLSLLPYPDSSSNIRFAHFRQWIGHETFVRFEAPAEDCVAFAEKVLLRRQARHTPNQRPVASRSSTDLLTIRSHSSSDLNTDWFDVQSIRQGMEGGHGPSHSPKLWIDMERGVCYYMQTD